MTTTIRMAALTALTWMALVAGAKAGMTYDIVNYPTLQNGYTVVGTITTDGNFGKLTSSSDITDWSITITGPVLTQPLILNPADSNAGGNTFEASSSAITVTGFDGITIATSDPQHVSFIQWTTGLNYWAQFMGGTLWKTPPSTDPFTVATFIPEPSSAVTAVIGVGTVIACGLVRNRRASRRRSAT
jgi:hypothetical protein